MENIKDSDIGFKDFLPFTRPCLSEKAINDVVECLQSGWITTGPRVEKFENALKEYLEAPHVMTVSSATAGLFLAVKALKLEPGSEVITTPMTFVSTINVLVQNGLKPVLVDICPITYNINIEDLSKKITSKTKLILPVHFAGFPVNLDELYALARKHELRVIEDAAHAIGTTFQNKKIGSFGDIQVFSFQANKNLTTGEGGCIVTRDESIAKEIRMLRFHGIDRPAWNRFTKSGSPHYDVFDVGYKFNLMDIQAALGLDQLANLEDFIETRNNLAKRYLSLLSQQDLFKLPAQTPPGSRHAWHLFTILTDKRDELVQVLKEMNVGTGIHYRAIHLFTYYQKHFGWKKGDFPQAELVSEKILSLPMFPMLSFEQLSKIVNCLIHAAKSLNLYEVCSI